MDYKRFRVRTPIKSFRDLEVYQEATKLSALIFSLQIPKKYQSEELSAELSTLRENSKLIIKFIVESYNDKFTQIKLARYVALNWLTFARV